MTTTPAAPENLTETFKAGTVLVAEGDRSRKMFVIKKGKARVFKNYLGQRITLAILGEGEIFGELSFFDAAPRSASVEALTDLTAIVFDGADTAKQIAGIPSWIMPVLRSTFQRFRETNQKIAVLQSMNDYKKKAFKIDNVAQSIYMELLRFLKTIKLIYESSAPNFGYNSTIFYSELEALVSSRTLGLRVFWNQLKEYEFMDCAKEEREKIVTLNLPAIDAWYANLSSEMQSERFLLLGSPSVAILRRLVSSIDQAENAVSGDSFLSLEAIGVDQVPLYEEGIKELSNRKLVRMIEKEIHFDAKEIPQLFLYQDLLKAYDHSALSLD